MARSNGKAKKPTEFPLRYIPCRIEPGMFREEFLVFLDAANPHDPNEKVKAQLLVDRRELSDIQGAPKRNDPARGWLRVTLIGQKGEWAEVVLPAYRQRIANVLPTAHRLSSAGSDRQRIA
jgi:hypothetical protein